MYITWTDFTRISSSIHPLPLHSSLSPPPHTHHITISITSETLAVHALHVIRRQQIFPSSSPATDTTVFVLHPHSIHLVQSRHHQLCLITKPLFNGALTWAISLLPSLQGGSLHPPWHCQPLSMELALFTATYKECLQNIGSKNKTMLRPHAM